MYDKVEIIDGSVVQHGKLSDRAYLMSLSEDGFPDIVGRLDELADERGYTKIFAKVPEWALPRFERAGHEVEATVPGFFGEGVDGHFTGKFLDESRGMEARPGTVEEVLRAAHGRPPDTGVPELPTGFDMSEALTADAADMAAVYREVFDTYPFPIHDPAFIEESIQSGETRFFVIRDGDGIAALSSAEIDLANGNAEMTDFATMPDYRGRNLAGFLLHAMEEEIRSMGIRVMYTIARAYSFGMNIVFSKRGYELGGTLTNNTNIAGGLESMNVWYKAA